MHYHGWTLARSMAELGTDPRGRVVNSY